MNGPKLDEASSNRPHNHGKTLPFHELYRSLFNPLESTKKTPRGAVEFKRTYGPRVNPQEMKRKIVRDFIDKWRDEVGDDIYPAFRLIIPDKDKERAMYGLKEKTIAKLVIRLVKINQNAEDAQMLLNWKQPWQIQTTFKAGDFAGRCYQVISRRAVRSKPSDMSIATVNEKLDALSETQREDEQLAIFQQFYAVMNAEEMMWLIRIILRQMKIGATENTIFNIWHPDAAILFSISSNLKKVCWELSDPKVRLAADEASISLMHCFQPQLAQFQLPSLERMVARMRPTEEDDVFWIEEKLDGERMQVHMVEDRQMDGGKRFGFWSRKAKEYTYLYGEHLFDETCSLTKYLEKAFHANVRNIILDGEMVTWNPSTDKIDPFGALKTAALNAKKEPLTSDKTWPLYRIFDILYLNDKPLTDYTLRDRRNALEATINPVHRRFELHQYTVGRSVASIEPLLRAVIAEGSEGLVLKNPRSAYHLNDRNDDWMKVKPEYMTGYGEELDCLIVGGYYGSGHRGGSLSSFMCGLRAPVEDRHGYDEKFWSFCKVGGGMSASDYATIRHQTEGKWHEWDRKNPPFQYLELSHKHSQPEQPDVWIRPSESIVISIKAASIVPDAKLYKADYTLRFPRFKVVRPDKQWQNAMTFNDLELIREQRYQEQREKRFEVEQRKRTTSEKKVKREVHVAGALKTDEFRLPQEEVGAVKDLFKGFTFFVMTESVTAPKKDKHDIEVFAKAHGASITNTATSRACKERKDQLLCIADRNTVKVSSLIKQGTHSIIRPCWVYDCAEQAKRDIARGRMPLMIPWEPRHVLFPKDEDKEMVGKSADIYSDGFACDIFSVDIMRRVMDQMPGKSERASAKNMLKLLQDIDDSDDRLPGHMFNGFKALFYEGREADAMHVDSGPEPNRSASKRSDDMQIALNTFRFAGGKAVADLHQQGLTHVVLEESPELWSEMRGAIKTWSKLPHLVTSTWIEQSWAEQTLLDEDRFSYS